MKLQKILWTLAAVLALLGTVLSGVTGMRFSSALSWALCLALVLYAALDRAGRTRRWAKLCCRALLALFLAGTVLFAAMEALVVRGAHGDAEGRKVSCVVILGAGVNGTAPSVSLASRLEAALAFLADKPELPVIVSGGQGPGEAISEAECMARWLTARGVAEERIIKEERSTSTRTNFTNSFALMAEHGIDPAEEFAFVTSDYHIARARHLSGASGARGVAAHLPEGAYFTALEINYFVREAFALANELLLGVDL